MRDGFDSVFFGGDRKDVVEPFEHEVSGLKARGFDDTGIEAAAFGRANAVAVVKGLVSGAVSGRGCAGMLMSGGSDDGGSDPMLGLSGVRKGDLNGFFNVFVASFSLRRLARDVDILSDNVALSVVYVW